MVCTPLHLPLPPTLSLLFLYPPLPCLQVHNAPASPPYSKTCISTIDFYFSTVNPSTASCFAVISISATARSIREEAKYNQIFFADDGFRSEQDD